MTNIFEQATRAQLRFETQNGQLSVEDLWQLPLQHASRVSLDSIAVGLNKELKDLDGAESFVKPSSTTTKRALLQLKFDVTKHIIDVKIAEKEARDQAEKRAANRQRILEELDLREQGKLKGMSDEELRAALND